MPRHAKTHKRKHHSKTSRRSHRRMTHIRKTRRGGVNNNNGMKYIKEKLDRRGELQNEIYTIYNNNEMSRDDKRDTIKQYEKEAKELDEYFITLANTKETLYDVLGYLDTNNE
jgi:hypothetical protein